MPVKVVAHQNPLSLGPSLIVVKPNYAQWLESVVNAHEETHIFWGTLIDPNGNLLVVLNERKPGEVEAVDGDEDAE